MTQLKTINRARTPINLANAYSWLDRYRILADVAPFSQELRTAEAIVEQQANAGILPTSGIAEIQRIKQRIAKVSEPVSTDEYRFLNLGEHLHPVAQERDRIVDEEYNLIEKSIGAMWERVTHLRTPITTKLLNNRSALEQYEEQYVYGRQLQMWQNPISDYLATYTYRMMNVNDPLQGALSASMAGMVLSAIPGTIGGFSPIGLFASAGALLGTVNKLREEPYIPARTREEREVRRSYDAHLYVRNMMLYNRTGDQRYLEEANKTYTSATLANRIPDEFTMRAYFGTTESELLSQITENVTKSDINRVLSVVPKEFIPSFYSELGMRGHAQEERQMISSEQIPLAPLESPIYNPNVAPESVAIQTMELRGLSSHSIGLGWYAQQARAERERQRGFSVTASTALPSTEGITTLKRYMADPSSLEKSFTGKLKEDFDIPRIINTLIRPVGGVILHVADDGFDMLNIEVTLI